MSRGSAVDYQADEQAGIAGLRWPQSSRITGRCRATQLVIIKQMSRRVSCGSAGDYQADEQAGVAWLRWRLSSNTFKSLIHFEFIFVYGVRKCSNFILLHVVVPFPQYHL